jgi:hypothetical protein
MYRLLLLTPLAASVFGLGRPQQSSRANLSGVATVQLPRSFHAHGPRRSGQKTGQHFDPAELEFHRNERQITFRFEEKQRRNMGGYFLDPVLLNVTLLNPAFPVPDAASITYTTIDRFYPPVDNDLPRFAAHFAAQRWLPDVRLGAAVTRVAAANEGRGDNLVSGPPERWLVIHIDPVRHVRVDLYTWRKEYSLDEARALVRRVAESVEVTPRLREVFESVKTVDAREAAIHTRAVTDAVGRLRASGIASLNPGDIAWSPTCAAWLSSDRRYLHVARSLGRVPLAAATREPREPPAFRVNELPNRSPLLVGPPDFQMLMFYWDPGPARWSLEGLGSRLYDDEPRESPLVTAIASRLTDRANVSLVSLARYDLKFWAERVAVDAFFVESDRSAAALRAGTLIPGVKAEPESFSR